MSLLTWEELCVKKYPTTDFLIDPYIPRESIVFLWGGTSIGKSPLTWELARAIGTGKSFFGLPSRQGKVLYLELDTPEPLVASRLAKLPPAPNVSFLFLKPLGIPFLHPEERDLLLETEALLKPDVVFINTLRKVHDMDDKDSKTPKVVYSTFQRLFPTSSLVFVHHMRKQSTDPHATSFAKESFSGSQHWLNDAQVGLHLSPFRGKRENLKLNHRKSQVSEKLRPLRLKLEKDGSSLTSPEFEELLSVYEIMNSATSSGGKLDQEIAGLLTVSLSTARRRREAIEAHQFPGSRLWLQKDPSLSEEDEDSD